MVFWLVDVNPEKIKKYPELMIRIDEVRKMRLESTFAPTRELAKYPTLFRDTQNPESFIVIPATTSENRRYIPFGFFDKNYIPLNSVYIIPNGDLFLFGVISSIIHMDWVRYVAGRLKSDYRYSKDIVYNNFPFPQEITDKQREQIETLAQTILDARTQFPDSSLADLYNPLTMPPKLLKAHEALDKAVDKLYRKEGFKSETERVAHLFELNKQLTSLIVNESSKKKK